MIAIVPEWVKDLFSEHPEITSVSTDSGHYTKLDNGGFIGLSAKHWTLVPQRKPEKQQ